MSASYEFTYQDSHDPCSYLSTEPESSPLSFLMLLVDSTSTLSSHVFSPHFALKHSLEKIKPSEHLPSHFHQLSLISTSTPSSSSSSYSPIRASASLNLQPPFFPVHSPPSSAASLVGVVETILHTLQRTSLSSSTRNCVFPSTYSYRQLLSHNASTQVGPVGNVRLFDFSDVSSIGLWCDHLRNALQASRKIRWLPRSDHEKSLRKERAKKLISKIDTMAKNLCCWSNTPPSEWMKMYTRLMCRLHQYSSLPIAATAMKTSLQGVSTPSEMAHLPSSLQRDAMRCEDDFHSPVDPLFILVDALLATEPEDNLESRNAMEYVTNQDFEQFFFIAPFSHANARTLLLPLSNTECVFALVCPVFSTDLPNKELPESLSTTLCALSEFCLDRLLPPLREQEITKMFTRSSAANSEGALTYNAEHKVDKTESMVNGDETMLRIQVMQYIDHLSGGMQSFGALQKADIVVSVTISLPEHLNSAGLQHTLPLDMLLKALNNSPSGRSIFLYSVKRVWSFLFDRPGLVISVFMEHSSQTDHQAHDSFKHNTAVVLLTLKAPSIQGTRSSSSIADKSMLLMEQSQFSSRYSTVQSAAPLAHLLHKPIFALTSPSSAVDLLSEASAIEQVLDQYQYTLTMLNMPPIDAKPASFKRTVSWLKVNVRNMRVLTAEKASCMFKATEHGARFFPQWSLAVALLQQERFLELRSALPTVAITIETLPLSKQVVIVFLGAVESAQVESFPVMATEGSAITTGAMTMQDLDAAGAFSMESAYPDTDLTAKRKRLSHDASLLLSLSHLPDDTIVPSAFEINKLGEQEPVSASSEGSAKRTRM